jgi:hypothetical protein
MASTYVNDLRLNEMATGDASGSWGTVTNTNLELIGEAFSYGTETIGDADSTLTIADGAADAARSFYLKITSSVDLTTTRIVTLAPNTVSKVWMIENATTGSQVITIKQGSGATINVPNGQVKMISTDGAGSGGAVLDLLVDVDLTGTTTLVNLDVSGAVDIAGDLTLSAGGDGALRFTAASSVKVLDNDAAALVFEEADNAYMTFVTTDGSEAVKFDKALDINAATQIDATVTVGVDDTGYDVKFFGATTGKSLLWDESADSLIVTGTTTLVGTTNLDVVDIDGATQIDATVTVGVDDTGYDVKFFGATAGAYMLWDESADDLILGGAAGLSVNSTALVTGVLTTTAATVHTGGITMPDNAKAIFGAGSDLEIYHDGSNSYIDDAGTGSFYIRSNKLYIQKYTGESMAIFTSDGAVDLRYDDAQKLVTTATGIDVTGTAVTDGLTVAGNLSVDGGTIKLDGNYPVGTGNVALGDTALDSNVSGGYNTAIGNLALTSCTSNYHTVVGSFAGQNLTTALASGAIGAYALNSNTTGPYNYAFGNSALQVNTTGGYNTAIGSSALTANTTASSNTAVGMEAGYSNQEAGYNTFIGWQSGYTFNTTGNAFNTFVGMQSGYFVTTGKKNSFIGSGGGGYGAGYFVTTGSANTILGAYNGNQDGLDIRTLDNYIVLSDGDGTPQAHFEPSGNFVVKRSANSSLQAVGCYNDTTANATNMHILSSGSIVRSTSSRKYKTDIQGADHGLDELMQLRSVTYKGTGNHDSDQLLGGLIAEEVHDAGLTEFVQYNDDGEPDALAYGNMVSLCIKAIQELSAKNDALTARITALEGA